MINTHKEAVEQAKKFGVNYSEFPSAVVTEGGNVYLTDNVDPKDTGKKFYLNTEDAESEEVIEEIEPKKGRKKQL